MAIDAEWDAFGTSHSYDDTEVWATVGSRRGPWTIRRLQSYMRVLSDDLGQVADPTAPSEPVWRQ